MGGNKIAPGQLELDFMASDADSPELADGGTQDTPRRSSKQQKPKSASSKAETNGAAKKVPKGRGVVTAVRNKKTNPAKTRGGKAEKVRKPQRQFPAVTLERALQVAYKIKEFNGGHPWAPVDIAAALDIGPRSPDFFYLTAASRDFGLTIGTRDTAAIELTDLGKELVYAPTEEAEHAKRKEAFLKVDLFARVLQHYNGSDLPPMKYLGNTLTKEFGVDEAHHEEFAKVFRENCSYLGITEGAGEAPPSKDGATVVVGETKKSGLKAFVIMPFVERNEQRPHGFFREVLQSLIVPAGINAGFGVETANRQGSDVIQSTIINDLLEADLVIADLTDHNPNVLFELGLRMAAVEKKPVALIKAKGTGKVFDVDNMLRVWEYRPELWTSTLESDLEELKQHIEGAWNDRDKRRSYISILRNPSPTPAIT